jgi:hypothetical protein
MNLNGKKVTLHDMSLPERSKRMHAIGVQKVEVAQ